MYLLFALDQLAADTARGRATEFPRLSSTISAFCPIVYLLSEFSYELSDMEIDSEKRRIGREIKRYLAVNRISRQEFSFQTKLGKSTIDKLITGIFSDSTLQIVLERTSFVRNNSFAAKQFGGYSRAAWSGYLRNYLFVLPSITQKDGLEAVYAAIEWDETIPGMVLVQKTGKAFAQSERIGILSIPHERSPLVYIQAVEGVGRTIIVSTMLGEPVMRGLMLTVSNLVANAFVPVALPVVLRRLEDKPSASDIGHVAPTDPRYPSLRSELLKVTERQYGKMLHADVIEPIKTTAASRRKNAEKT